MADKTEFPIENKALKVLEYLINSERFKLYTQSEQHRIVSARDVLLNYLKEVCI